jgi:hypothetical protein
MEKNMELIDLASFNQCDKCEKCQLPIHLLNYPKLINLDQTQLSSLQNIYEQLPPNILNNNNHLKQFMNMIKELCEHTHGDLDSYILKISNKNKIKEMAQEMAQEETKQINEEKNLINDECEDLKQKLSSTESELSSTKYSCDHLQIELKKVEDKTELKITKAVEKEEKIYQSIIEMLEKDKFNLTEQNKFIQTEQSKSIQNNTEAVQQFTNINNNSNKKGKLGEESLKLRVIPSEWEWVHTRDKPHQSDFHIWNPKTNNRILIECKNYKTIIPGTETIDRQNETGLINDVKNNHMKGGVMISLQSGIYHHTKSRERNVFDFEIIENIPYFFISKANTISDELLKDYMITFDKLISNRSEEYNEHTMLLLSQSINNLNLLLENISSIKDTIRSTERSFKMNMNKFKKLVGSHEDEVKSILYNLSENNEKINDGAEEEDGDHVAEDQEGEEDENEGEGIVHEDEDEDQEERAHLKALYAKVLGRPPLGRCQNDLSWLKNAIKSKGGDCSEGAVAKVKTEVKKVKTEVKKMKTKSKAEKIILIKKY